MQLTDYYPFGDLRLNETDGFDEQRKFASMERDSDTGLDYAKARYYNSGIGRWISQDPAFLVVGTPNLKALTGRSFEQYLIDIQGMNSYSYTKNNPLTLIDTEGSYWLFPKTRASNDIRNNRQNIVNAANQYQDVRLEMVASVIYQERYNANGVNPLDSYDVPLGYLGVDTSIGLGQVKISTAKMLVDKGYISRESVGMENNRNYSYVNALQNNEYNSIFVAGYLQYLIDNWKGEYSEITNDIGVLATLYNKGVGEPHSSPGPSPEFGEKAQANYDHVKSLLKEDDN